MQLGSSAPKQSFRSGERVTIVRGPFRDMDALFERELNAAGRVLVLLQLVHGTARINIQQECLQRA
jgi:transcription antitermination factor NusG